MLRWEFRWGLVVLARNMWLIVAISTVLSGGRGLKLGLEMEVFIVVIYSWLPSLLTKEHIT